MPDSLGSNLKTAVLSKSLSLSVSLALTVKELASCVVRVTTVLMYLEILSQQML